MSVASPVQSNADLVEFAASCVDDPLLFVQGAYPWGEPGTLLADETGPDTWQVTLLEDIRDHLLSGETHALQEAVVSGHGVGKSALTSWLIQWFLTTRPHPQVVVTANTSPQLETKTWRELAKWHKLSCFADWFEWTATKYAYGAHRETWFAAALPWRRERPEAFAGTHEKHVLLLFDEASAVDDIIWETAEGAMTTPGAMWFTFGNGTRNTGRFKECFPGGRFAHRWRTHQVDSRTAKKADQQQITQWIADYGDDSDFVRVRVKGQFPRAGSTQYIGSDLIDRARQRERLADATAPVIVGVDVARFGDDRSVIRVRKGGQLLAKKVYREKSTVEVAGYVAEVLQTYPYQAVFVDADGVGGGVYDQLVSLGYKKVHAVHSGARASDPMHYANKRAEMWARAKGWLEHRGQLGAEDETLIVELTGIEYGYDVRGCLQMEQKKDMKKRGLASPDEADSLVLTFAEPVAPIKRPERPVNRGGLWAEDAASPTGWMG